MSKKIIFIILSLTVSVELTILLSTNTEQLNLQGEQEVYLKFKEKVANLPPGQQHEEAHLFGEALFKNLGLDGISVCDNSFAFGCYHAFLGIAIHAKGLEVVPILNEKCIEKLKTQALGCQHGIGHGILADVGYQFDNLNKALDVCDQLPVKDPIGGCVGGVFMEYNFQTMLMEKGRTRSFDARNSHYPCKQVFKKYQPACYFWQGQWWANVLPGDLEKKYQKIGLLCQEALDSTLRIQCFLGSGNTVGQFVNWDPQRALSLCSKISSFDGKLMCRAGAAGSFMAEPKAKGVAFLLCDGLEEKYKQDCLDTAKLSIGSIQ